MIIRVNTVHTHVKIARFATITRQIFTVISFRSLQTVQTLDVTNPIVFRLPYLKHHGMLVEIGFSLENSRIVLDTMLAKVTFDAACFASVVSGCIICYLREWVLTDIEMSSITRHCILIIPRYQIKFVIMYHVLNVWRHHAGVMCFP